MLKFYEKSFLFTLVVLFPSLCFSQFIQRTSLELPSNNTSGKIKIERFVFDKFIDDILSDSSGNELLLSLKSKNPRTEKGKKSSFLKFNCADNAIVWESEAYPAYISKRFDETLMLQNVNDSEKKTFLDLRNGRKLWKGDFEYVGYSRFDSTVIGNLKVVNPMNAKYELYKSIHGYSAKTGQSIWSKDLPIGNWTQSSIKLNDSLLLFENNGPHGINLKTRETWSYIQPSESCNYTVVIDDNELIRYRPKAFETPELKSSIQSNFVFSGDSIFHAGMGTLVCVTRSGKVIWEKDLNPNESTKSKLIEADKYLILLNLGFLYKNGVLSTDGQPFVRVFDRNTGDVLLNHDFPPGKFIKDYIFRKNTILVLSGEEVMQLNLETPVTINSISIPDSLRSQLISFVQSDFYLVTRESKILYYPDSLPDLFIKLKNDVVVCLDTNWQVKDKFWTNGLVQLNYIHPKFKMYINRDNLFLTNDKQKILYNTKSGWNFEVRKNYIFLVYDKLIDRIRISDLN